MRPRRARLNGEAARYVPPEEMLHRDCLAGAKQRAIDHRVVDVGGVFPTYGQAEFVRSDPLAPGGLREAEILASPGEYDEGVIPQAASETGGLTVNQRLRHARGAIGCRTTLPARCAVAEIADGHVRAGHRQAGAEARDPDQRGLAPPQKVHGEIGDQRGRGYITGPAGAERRGAELAARELHDVEARLPEPNADHLLGPLPARLGDREPRGRIAGTEQRSTAGGIAPHLTGAMGAVLGLGKLLVGELGSKSPRIVHLVGRYPLPRRLIRLLDARQPARNGACIAIDAKDSARQTLLLTIEYRLHIAQGHRQHSSLARLENAESAGEFGERRGCIHAQIEREARGVLQLSSGIIYEARGQSDPDGRRFREW